MELNKNNKIYGFTLLELLLSVSILAILVAITAPILIAFQRNNDIDLTADTLSQVLRRAQILSQAINNDDSWGVKIDNNNIILFKGNSFIGRNQNYDETFSTSNSITFSGINEIIYNKFSGDTTGGSIIMTNTTENKNISINVNSKGIVEIQ